MVRIPAYLSNERDRKKRNLSASCLRGISFAWIL